MHRTTVPGVKRSALALILTVACASSAHATVQQHRPSDGQVRTVALKLARKVWPKSTCAGHEVIHLRADKFLDSLPLTGSDAALGAAGYADQATCQAWVRSDLRRAYLCLTIVHELGHLANGPGHTKSGIMAADASDYQPCDTAVAKL